MNLRQVVYPFSIAVVLVMFQPHGKADTNVEESRDLRESIQAARQSVASIFSGLLNSILAARAGNPVTSEPQFKLVFSVGAGGKVVDTTTGFECESECEVTLENVLRATYEVIPDEDYQFAGWSGDICNGPAKYLNSTCDVVIGWSRLGADDVLRVKANFARSANLDSATATDEFEVSSYGFGSFYSTEVAPTLCYPTLDDCDAGGMGQGIAYIDPDNTAQGDFNRDGHQDILIMPYMPYGYVRQQKAYPTIFLNNGHGGLYRSDSIFAEGSAAGMDFGYRLAVTDFNGDSFDDFLISAMGTLSREPHNYMEFVGERHLLYLSGPDGKLHDKSDQIAGQENGASRQGPEQGILEGGSHYLATGDIDGDGDIDAWFWPGLFVNDGSGELSFTESWFDLCGCWDGIMSSLIADLDGDDIGDLVVFQSDPESTSKLFLSNGESSLAGRQITTLPPGEYGVQNTKHNHADATDVDGDGDVDIVIGQTRANPYYKGRYLQLLINDGAGNFSDETAERLGPQTAYADGEAPPDGEGVVYLLDVNGDGYTDIFDRRAAREPKEGAPIQAAASIWLNNGEGYFTDVPPTVFPTIEPKDLAPRFGDHWQIQGLRWAAPIHLNADGYIDLVSYVLTDYELRTESGFYESTLYTLTAKKKLEAGDYADQE